MKTYTLTIWHYNSLLLEGKYSFKTRKEAELFTDGIFRGLYFCGKEPTGKVLTVKK